MHQKVPFFQKISGGGPTYPPAGGDTPPTLSPLSASPSRHGSACYFFIFHLLLQILGKTLPNDRTSGCVSKMVCDLGWESLQKRRQVDRLTTLYRYKIQRALVETETGDIVHSNDRRTSSINTNNSSINLLLR